MSKNMKLKEYIKLLENFAEVFPEALDLDVVYSTDDEGNSFHKVQYGPSIGTLVGKDFSAKDFSGKDLYGHDCNAVCLN